VETTRFTTVRSGHNAEQSSIGRAAADKIVKLFLDSSALAKRYVAETGSEDVDSLCRRATVLGVSIICVPEVISALCRLRREKKLNLHEYESAKQAFAADLRDAIVCGINEPVIQRSLTVLEKCPVRAMDALHIGCALEWKNALFVSSDKQQLAAAKAMGLKTRKI